MFFAVEFGKRVDMKTVIHRAGSRGFADHGWLQSWHTFSFAGYYDPARVHFGALRVINDDVIGGGEGFGTHPHDNMEIITVPLSGELRHGDSMGNVSVLRPGEIQVMSAGTGITHSEYNNLPARPLKLLQIWVFPEHRALTPRYDNLKLPRARPNELRTLVTPENKREEGAAWIHQQAWFHTLDLDDHIYEYRMRLPGNGLYLFVIEGDAKVAGNGLARRDGIGVWEAGSVTLEATGKALLLLMEVPA